ncbi:MAG: response regulator [Oligoflexales bacterium]
MGAEFAAKILVVEDSFHLRKLVARVLKMDGFQVFEAANGQDALSLLEQTPDLDLVLLDLSMPNMDGFEFVRHFKERKGPSIPKIAVVSGMEDLSAHARDLGVDGYIRKPVDLYNLTKEVQRLISPPAADGDLKLPV